MTTSLGVLSFTRSTSSERMKMVASVLASKSRMRSSSLPAMTRVGSAGSTIHASASSGMPGAGVMEGTGVMEAPGVTDAFGAVGSPPSPSSGGADGGVSPPSPLPSGGADGGVSPSSPLPSGGADGGVSPSSPLPSGGADGGVSPSSPLPSGGADGGVPSPPCRRRIICRRLGRLRGRFRRFSRRFGRLRGRFGRFCRRFGRFRWWGCSRLRRLHGRRGRLALPSLGEGACGQQADGQQGGEQAFHIPVSPFIQARRTGRRCVSVY